MKKNCLFAFCREDVSVYLLTVFDTRGSPPAHRPGAPTVVGGQIPVGSVCVSVCGGKSEHFLGETLLSK